jgi:hypothetical protein
MLQSSCNRVSIDTTTSAYVAPATLNIRPAISQKNSSVAVLHHGDRVGVVDVRRRFVKVRTAKGVEGWVDAGQLLNADKWAQVQRDTEAALKLPSEGAAGVYEPLNIHIEPNRQSPAFAQIPEGGSVEVLAHKLEPKLSGPSKPPVFNIQRPQPARKSDRKSKDTKSAFPLPKLAPPKPPADALETESDTDTAKDQPPAPAKPPILEDWTLVRTKDRQVGWVLTRNLVMSIPDEVAQYAEGHRITSYFQLGAVNDEEKGKKYNWLWTTMSDQERYDFDAWRVFTWNRRRHRYETSHRQHDVEGYFPVQVEPADPGVIGRRFSLILRDDNGKFWLKSFRFDGTVVHADGVAPYVPPSASANQH